MEQSKFYQNLANNLRSIIGILELDKRSQLYRDAIAICDYLENPIFRIAVFCPFNRNLPRFAGYFHPNPFSVGQSSKS